MKDASFSDDSIEAIADKTVEGLADSILLNMSAMSSGTFMGMGGDDSFEMPAARRQSVGANRRYSKIEESDSSMDVSGGSTDSGKRRRKKGVGGLLGGFVAPRLKANVGAGKKKK